MVKPEWGTKRACPKCNTRFYDLGNEDPVVCINCGNAWVPESMLKSKQPLPFEAAKPTPKENEDGEIIADDDLDVAEDAEEPDVDIGEDEDLAVVVPGEEDDEA
ncbi:MAG: TIGR02300 family protein [Sphingomonadaceae bacterium]|nr:TIGR02300 family protein [Sphingomonadaceae bacterium]